MTDHDPRTDTVPAAGAAEIGEQTSVPNAGFIDARAHAVPHAGETTTGAGGSQKLAIWAMWLGIASIVFALIPVIGALPGLGLALPALLLGTTALRRGQTRRLSIAGIATGAAGAAISVANGVITMLFAGVVGMMLFSTVPVHLTADVEDGKSAVVTWTGEVTDAPSKTISGPWSRDLNVDTMDYGSVTVTADPGVQVSCSASSRGVLGEKKVGDGTVTCNSTR